MQNQEEMVNQLVQKDQQIALLQEEVNSYAKTVQNSASGQPLTGLKPNGSQHFDSHASEGQIHSVEKSAERQKAPILIGKAAQPEKDWQKEFQKAKKALQFKEKEILKMRAEVQKMQKETTEKTNKELQVNKDVESQVKSLKDQLRSKTVEIKRKEERLTEQDSRLKRLEDS